MNWFRAKRDRERQWAIEFIKREGSVAERKAHADLAVSRVGVQEEAEWEALKAVVRTLDTRAAIGMAILKSHGRVSPGTWDAPGPVRSVG